jgi:Pyruvate/2-oxoacid:ferredoxin oxidoreductase gamma subunit
VAIPFTRIADELGLAKAANVAALGALLECTGVLDERFVLAALRRKIKSPQLLETNVAVLARGRAEARRGPL